MAPVVSQNYTMGSDIEIPVYLIGYPDAYEFKAALELAEKNSTMAVTAILSGIPYSGLNHLVMWQIYFFGLLFTILAVLELLFIIIIKVYGGSQAELYATILGFVLCICTLLRHSSLSKFTHWELLS